MRINIKNFLKINLLDLLFFLNLITIITFGSYSSFYKYIVLLFMNLILFIITSNKFRTVHFYTFLKTIKKWIFIYLIYSLVVGLFGLNYLNSLSVFLKYIFFFIILLMFHIWIFDTNKGLKVLKSIYASSVLVSVSIILEFLISGRDLTLRYGGIISNINNAGFIVSFGLILGFIIQKQKLRVSKLYLFLFFIKTIALLLTGSRSAILFLGVTFLVNILFKRSFKLRNVVIFIAFVFFIISLGFVNRVYIINSLLRLNSGTSGRNFLWQASYFIWKDYSVFGIGLGNFKIVLPDYLMITNIGDWSFRQLSVLNSSHSMLIDSIVQLGIIGGCFLLVICIKVINLIRKNRKINSDRKELISDELIFSIFFGILIRSFFEPFGFLNYAYITVDILFWLTFIIYQNQYNKLL
jgi:hypothetical protein